MSSDIDLKRKKKKLRSHSERKGRSTDVIFILVGTGSRHIGGYLKIKYW